MKKILLFTLAIGIAVSVSAQVKKYAAHINGNTAKYSSSIKLDVPVNQTSIVKSTKTNTNIAKTNNVVTDIVLGTAGNALGFYGDGRTYLWADDNIGAVSFVHRAAATPGSGFLQCDLSFDNGATWGINKGPVYSPDGTTTFNARYPQGAIYNPSSNTDYHNAYFAYFAPTLDGSNTNWGGQCVGVYKLDTVTAATQTCFTSGGAYHQVIPDAFHITQTGVAWGMQPSETLDANSYAMYTDSMIMYKGVWNSGTNDFDYTRSLLYLPVTHTGSVNSGAGYQALSDYKIAFAPDGLTGYIALLGHNDYTFMPDSIMYPILYKTTNGGTTWTGPIDVDISSIPDIQAIYGDTIAYTTGFDIDLAVDGTGNPYFVTEVSPAPGGWSIATAPGLLTVAAIYSTDGGTNWDARVLEYVETFRGTFTDGTNTVSSDNRPQVATNMDGTAMFFTWIDTDTLTFGSANGNYYPDIHLRGFDLQGTDAFVVKPALTSTSNVTTGSTADGAAYMGSASYYVFELGSNQYEVPMAYQQMDPVAPLTQVTYHYIKGAICDLTPSGIKENNDVLASVSQNYPNPVNGTSVVTVNLSTSSDLSMSISNLLGQKVYENSKGTVNAGTYHFNIDGSSLSAGVYTYTVKAGDYTVTHKMVVE